MPTILIPIVKPKMLSTPRSEPMDIANKKDLFFKLILITTKMLIREYLNPMLNLSSIKCDNLSVLSIFLYFNSYSIFGLSR